MSMTDTVLVLSSCESRARDLITILEFIGEESVLADDASRQLLASGDRKALDELRMAVVSGQDPARMQEDIEAVCKAESGLPILLVGNPDLGSLDDDCQARIIARLEWPPNYTKLIDSLYRAQVYRDQHTRSRGRERQREIMLFRSLVGTSRSVKGVRELMSQVADKDVSVLITGESGTGKEVGARNLHYHSPRREKPFVPVNCGAIPAELLE
ncbi:MAG: sigma 54-interacting transcriptional regulator, partial [Marinobacter sp.]